MFCCYCCNFCNCIWTFNYLAICCLRYSCSIFCYSYSNVSPCVLSSTSFLFICSYWRCSILLCDYYCYWLKGCPAKFWPSVWCWFRRRWWWSLLSQAVLVLLPSMTWLSVMIAGISLPRSLVSICRPSIFDRTFWLLPRPWPELIYCPFAANLMNSVRRPCSRFGLTVDVDLLDFYVRLVCRLWFDLIFGRGRSCNRNINLIYDF